MHYVVCADQGMICPLPLHGRINRHHHVMECRGREGRRKGRTDINRISNFVPGLWLVVDFDLVAQLCVTER